MARIAVEMPRLGYDMEAGSVAAWLKRPGDSVERGEAIAEVATEKTTVEMEAVASGTLAELVVDAGVEVPVGSIIAWIDDGGP